MPKTIETTNPILMKEPMKTEKIHIENVVVDIAIITSGDYAGKIDYINFKSAIPEAVRNVGLKVDSGSIIGNKFTGRTLGNVVIYDDKKIIGSSVKK